MSSIWLRNPLAIFTENDSDAGGRLVVDTDSGTITELVAPGRSPTAAVDSTYEARDHVVIPGLINTHHHFYQTLTRAWAPVVNVPLFPWLVNLYPVWARLTPVRWSSRPLSRWPSSCSRAARPPPTTTYSRAGWRTPSTSR